MIDWTGSRIRADSETVLCRFCGAEPGVTCVSKHPATLGQPITHFPAHTVRITDSQKAHHA